ncbi:MAG: hypothetical protein AAFR61_23500 [Bacteroidota bacterium]
MKKILVIVLLFGFWSCGEEGSPSTATQPATPVQEAPEKAPEAVEKEDRVEDKIATILDNYYQDLASETLNENTYFAPVVEEFFNSKSVPRETVGTSLKRSFETVENRKIEIDPATLRVEETAAGYRVEFDGKTAYQQTQTKETVEQSFRNQVEFNHDMKIIAYRSLGSESRRPAQTKSRSLGQQSPLEICESLAGVILPEFKSGQFTQTPRYFHPQLGAFYVGQPGAYSVPYHLPEFKKLFLHAPWFEQGMKELAEKTSVEAFPDFNCEGEMYSKLGCFLEEIDGYDGVSSLMKALQRADVGKFNEKDIQQAQSIERLIKARILDTNTDTAFYFGESGGKWYLLIVDQASFSCSA